MPDIQHSRLIELIEYARQTALMRDSPKAVIEDYRTFCAYEHHVRGLPGVHLDTSPIDDSDEIWLTIDRLREVHPPPIDDPMLAVWIDVTNNPAKTPFLKEFVYAKDLQAAGFEKENFPDQFHKVVFESFVLKEDLKDEFESYFTGVWKNWSDVEKPRRETITLYGNLFTLKQQLEGGITDAPLELFWGIGIVLWKMNGVDVRLPLITKGVELSLNDGTMAIDIRPRELDPRVELELYSNADNPEVAKVQKAAGEFFANTEETISPFAKSTFEGLLKSATTFLDPKGIYWPDQNPDLDSRSLPSSDENLKITDSWVLFARPRGSSIFIQDLERFQHKLKQGGEQIELPNAVAAIVTEPSTEYEDVQLPSFRGLSMVSGNSNIGVKPQDLFFPMAFNDEQVNIVQHLETTDGVVVQGPPGTGKTHTIANIICHNLALGKRVLVTSMREPALTVLQEKLPEDIRPLAVSLLTSESKGMKQFQFAIEQIASIAQTADRASLNKLIQQQEEELDEYHSRIAKFDRQIAEWADLNLRPIELDDENIEPRVAAEEVIQNIDEWAWLDDLIGVESMHQPKFNDTDIQNVRAARAALGEDLDYLNSKLPDLSAIPDARDVLETHRTLARLEELENQVKSGEIPELVDSAEQTFEAVRITLSKVEALKKLRQEIDSDGAKWATSMIARLRRSSPDDTLLLFCKIGSEINSAAKENQKFLARPVVLPDNFEDNDELVEAVSNLAYGNRPFGLIGIFAKSEQKKQLGTIKIVGSHPVDQADWGFVGEFMNHRKCLSDLVIRWNAVSHELGVPQFPVEPSSAIAAASEFNLYKKLTDTVQLEILLIEELKLILPHWNKAAAIGDNETIADEAAQILQLHLSRNRLAKTWVIKEQFNKVLEGCTGTIVERFRLFYENLFGHPEVSDSAIQMEWTQLLDELRRVQSLQLHLETVNYVTSLIETSGGINWAQKLRTTPKTSTVESLLPNNWQQAWRLKRLTSYLEASDSRATLKSLMKQRLDTEKQLAKTYEETIKNRTFLKLKENTTPSVSSALAAFRTAIGKIGRGTGKRAVRYRHDARNAAQQANFAIPCWIMPHYRVSESLPAELGSFDLVIIDEASQSDLTALPALLRAKKVLVVGDEKQVSPEGIGVSEEKIIKLMNLYLANQITTFRPQMTPERSIYDLFKVVFAKSGVMLREHFRCVAPIIEYSRREFYNHEIIPLRLPKASERLDPPLIDVLVEDGIKTRDINKPEAKFIVDEIKRLTEDPTLNGRSIGVVSLLGTQQAKLIFERLEQEIGFEKMEEYRIACGDARTFQGNERDIMFLTMVASKNDAHPITRDTFAQRFNVAASRARDRMYLVRSVDSGELSPSDKYRHSLLRHFELPFSQDEQRVESLRDKCESDFEREVYDVLTQRGFKVIPQVPVGGFRIDMVVEGNDDERLAIECDGDQYHGPGRWDDDMRRQRILERAGWSFWRCFASTFVMHREEVIKDLLESLTSHGVGPMGFVDANSSRYVEHRRYSAYHEDPELTKVIESTDDHTDETSFQTSLFPEIENM